VLPKPNIYHRRPRPCSPRNLFCSWKLSSNPAETPIRTAAHGWSVRLRTFQRSSLAPSEAGPRDRHPASHRPPDRRPKAATFLMQIEKGPAMSRASVSVTFAVGSLRWPDRSAWLHSGSVAEHSLNAPGPLRDRPCHVVQRRPGETLLHFREVQRLCCDRCLPCRFHQLSSQRATTRRTPSRSEKSRNGVVRIWRRFRNSWNRSPRPSVNCAARQDIRQDISPQHR